MPIAAETDRRPILIRNGYVVPGAHRPHLERADILIEGNAIAALGCDLLSQGAVASRNPRVIDDRRAGLARAGPPALRLPCRLPPHSG